jgi:hypothetical protein
LDGFYGSVLNPAVIAVPPHPTSHSDADLPASCPLYAQQTYSAPSIKFCVCSTVLCTLQFAYALRALVINEFRSPQWSQRVLGVPGASTMGQAALISFDFYTDEAWIGIGIAFL